MTQTEALALTLMIESLSAVALAAWFRIPAAACALSAIVSSMVTHPLLWAVFYPVASVVGPLTTPLLEALVFLAEAPFYRTIARIGWSDALLMSLLVNAASWGAGEVMYALA